MAQPNWTLVRRLLVDEESVVLYPYDDNRKGPLRRIGRAEVQRVGWRYVVTATGGTATIGAGITNPGVVDRHWDRDMTPEEERAAYQEEIGSYWTDGIERWLTRPLPTPNAAAALVSFAWNAGKFALPIEDGPIGYRAPGLLRALNDGRWADAAEALKVAFTKQPDYDLRPRREHEAEVFLEGLPSDDDWAWVLPLVAA